MSEEEASIVGFNTSNIRFANEGKDRVHSKWSDMIKQEFTIMEIREKRAEEHNDYLGFSLLTSKTVGEFEERLEWLQRLYVREAKRFQGQLELSKTREKVQQYSVCIYMS